MTALNGEGLDWESFSRDDIFQSLTDVSGFRLEAELPILGIWGDDRAATYTMQLIYDSILGALVTAKLHYPNRLSAVKTDRRMSFEYGDDVYRFEVVLEGAILTIRRSGSSLKRFYTWYMTLAPHFRLLVEKVCAAISTALQETTGISRPIVVQRVSTQFEVIVLDFRAPRGAAVVRNVGVMEKVLPRAPGVDGRLIPIATELESFARVDASFSKWMADGGSTTWREVFRVEAPGNREWTTLWLAFTRIGETYPNPTGAGREERVPFEALKFLGDYVGPLVGTFRDRGVRGFLSEIMEGYSFRSTPSDPA